MSRITNDTACDAGRLSQVSSDVFKQPVSIVLADRGSALHGLEIYPGDPLPFPDLHRAHSNFGSRARQAVQIQQENVGQMVVTMQETFAGIRVVKSFAREDHQEKVLRGAPCSNSATPCAWSNRRKRRGR